MTTQLIPLDSNPNQTWQTTVTINNGVSTFVVLLSFNEVAQYWVMSLFDAGGNLLVDSLSLVTGTNILGQFQYLLAGSVYILNASGVTNPNYPNSTDLGTDFVLVWGDNVTVSVAA